MNQPGHDFGGMTVNERLVAAGLLGPWDEAIGSGDRLTAIDLLRRVAVTETSATATVDAVLANPARYGFFRTR